ncbi:Ig-like domain-containing protein [Janthinobacterium sp. MP5059B]|uniref:Ig-like domain-containing protein n=1 Tax=Janthinobacterium sp. MP5059B TaxID=1766683 RepID=UPI000874723C|nr:Ig-like domain-containing protein [Janthinobacterium sp. MP5059B]
MLALGTLLAACGGGGGDPTIDGGSSGGTTGGVPATVSVSLLNANGQASSTVSVNAPLTARAQVLDKNGAGVANALVTFAVDSSLAVLAPATALTDAKGIASVTMRPASSAASGAGKVTASVTTAAVTVSGEANYQISSSVASKASIGVALLTASGSASNALSSSAPLTAVAIVKDQDGKPLPDALVVFATDNALATLSPSAGTTLSDAKGEARVILRPVSLAVGGAGTLTAAVVMNGTTSTSAINYVVGATTLTFGNIAFETPSLEAYGSTQVSLDVLSGSVKYTDQSLAVNFTSSCVTAGKATFAPVVQTANGSARAVYRDLGCGVNDVISATASGVSGSRSAVLPIAAPQAASVQFYSAIPADKSIVIKGEGGLLRSETATLKFRVFDTFNNPLPGLKVSFLKADPNAEVDLNPVSGTTDANGEVTTSVSSRSTPLSFRIRATLDGKGVSTLSDSIVVSTGTPVQKAFSLSISDSNVEGLDVDANGSAASASVTVAMGDKFGNPVADGTPVAFQTNVGVVGSASKGGCNSVNGACSVDFRAQQPRVPTPNTPATVCNGPLGSSDSTRAGVGTICASTSDGSATPIFAKINFFISGSRPATTILNGNRTLTTGNDINDLGDVNWNVPKVFTLQINDINNNPMPSGTSVEVANIVRAASGGVSPSTVQKTFPSTASAPPLYQGTSHLVTISSPSGVPCTPGVATFNVNITTPHLLTTSYPFKLTFTCQ